MKRVPIAISFRLALRIATNKAPRCWYPPRGGSRKGANLRSLGGGERSNISYGFAAGSDASSRPPLRLNGEQRSASADASFAELEFLESAL
jgi:hypothetical protein